jgi:hypothetical protein
MGARTRRIFHDDNTRAKIQTTLLIGRLQDFIDGKIELSTDKIKAISILLKKTLPDLSAIEHSGEVATTNATELTDEQLLAIAAASSVRAAKKKGGKEKLNSVH